MSDRRGATDKQIRYALSLLKQAGVGPNEVVDVQTGRRWGLPVGDTVSETVKVLSSRECSALIDKLREGLE